MGGAGLGKKRKMKTVRGLFGFGGEGRGFLFFVASGQGLDLLVEGGRRWKKIKMVKKGSSENRLLRGGQKIKKLRGSFW